jgi:hypothetical protein
MHVIVFTKKYIMSAKSKENKFAEIECAGVVHSLIWKQIFLVRDSHRPFMLTSPVFQFFMFFHKFIQQHFIYLKMMFHRYKFTMKFQNWEVPNHPGKVKYSAFGFVFIHIICPLSFLNLNFIFI